MDAATIALVLAGGDPVDAALARRLPAAGLVIAADSGLAQAEALGLRVDVVVGDMDSVDPAALAAAAADGAAVELHPRAKDATDLELATLTAVARGAATIIVLGGLGGRLDHFLGNALLLGSPALSGCTVEWWVQGYRMVVVRDRVTLKGTPGDIVTLLALGGSAGGVSTTGLRWPLQGEDLGAGSTRGVSNEMTDAVATVAVSTGSLLAIHRLGAP